jgi:hypothetical protein
MTSTTVYLPLTPGLGRLARIPCFIKETWDSSRAQIQSKGSTFWEWLQPGPLAWLQPYPSIGFLGIKPKYPGIVSVIFTFPLLSQSLQVLWVLLAAYITFVNYSVCIVIILVTFSCAQTIVVSIITPLSFPLLLLCHLFLFMVAWEIFVRHISGMSLPV